MSTVGPAGVLHPPEPLDPLTARVDALLDPLAAGVDALLELPVELLELLHAANDTDSAPAAITAKSHERRFLPIDSPGVDLAR